MRKAPCGGWSWALLMRRRFEKSESRTPKEIRNPKAESPVQSGKVLQRTISDFGLRPSFGFRISTFGFGTSDFSPNETGYRHRSGDPQRHSAFAPRGALANRDAFHKGAFSARQRS